MNTKSMLEEKSFSQMTMQEKYAYIAHLESLAKNGEPIYLSPEIIDYMGLVPETAMNIEDVLDLSQNKKV